MCGICGFNWEDKQLVKKMTRVISHRGLDNKDYYIDRRVSLGHQRLSIINLSKTGHQPMSNEDGNIWVVYNGEIYNFQEIRQKLEAKGHRFKSDTDTEVIIHAYEEYGVCCLHLFNGMFAFCIYDSINKKLFLARDRVGIKPLYYYWDDQNFIFASEIKAILESKIKRNVNLIALNNYICLRYNSGVQTLFDGIKRLHAGYYLEFDLKNKKLKLNKYWDLSWGIAKDSESILKKKVYHLFKESVRKRLISDVPLGVYLSGGVDSGSIVALMSQINKETDGEIKTFSVGFEKGEHVNELNEARYISDLFGTKHREFIVQPSMVKLLPEIIWHLDEPMADPALIPLYLLSEKASKEVKVVLTGDGGDEVFGGYDQYKFLLMGRKLAKFPLMSPMIPKVMKLTPKSILNRFYKHTSAMGAEGLERIHRFLKNSKCNPAGAYYELVSIFDEKESEEIMGNKFSRTDYRQINGAYFDRNIDFLKQLLYFDIKNLLPESFLMKTDRMTMAHSIEARVPLLDHKLVEFGFSIPSRYKIYGGQSKFLLKESMSKLIPREFLYRKKQTFHVPIENWIESDLKDFCGQVLSKDKIIKQGFFDYGYIDKILKNYKKSRLFYARQLWNLINFQIWYEKFIEK